MTSEFIQIAKRVKWFIDLDGFKVDGSFKIKEMAIGNMDTSDIYLGYYQLEIPYDKLSLQDRREVNWVTYHVTGLAFQDFPGDQPQTEVNTMIEELCRKAEVEDRVIAYKGGNHEKDLLNKFGTAGFNIELLGCPKLEKLLQIYFDDTVVQKYKCDRHGPVFPRKSGDITVAHCPRLEVFCFMDVIRRFVQN